MQSHDINVYPTKISGNGLTADMFSGTPAEHWRIKNLRVDVHKWLDNIQEYARMLSEGTREQLPHPPIKNNRRGKKIRRNRKNCTECMNMYRAMRRYRNAREPANKDFF